MIISAVKINQFEENQSLELLLLVRRRNLARSRNGKDYLNFRLGDSSGEITAFLWDDIEAAKAIREGDCVRIKGRSQLFNGKLQLNLNSIVLEKGPVDPGLFLPRGDKHIPTMEIELKRLVADIRNPWLRRLNEAFFVKDEDFARDFALAPAAKAMHHAWLGGLLEHSLGVARLALKVCPLYPRVDQDLVLTGALLHDIGKVEELVYQRSLDYSSPGRLLGHVMIGARMIRDKAQGLRGFPPDLLLLVEHLILSHHGEYEFGSPKKPKTLEALLVNFLDDLDAKMVGVTSFMDSAGPDQEWTDYHRLFGRPFYLGGRPADEKPAAGESDHEAEPESGQTSPRLF